MTLPGNPNPTVTPREPLTAAQVLDASASPTPPNNEASKTDPAPKDETVSGKFQALIQREKQALQREMAAKARESAAETRAREIEAREAKVKEFESLKETNPLKALELLGLNYQQLTQVALADGNVTPDLKIKKVEDKFDSFLKSQEEEKRQQSEDAQKKLQAQSEATITKFKTEIGDYIKENSSRYELIQFEQSEELVYDVVDEHYNRTLLAAQKKAEEEGEDTSSVRGDILTIAQAADKIEAHLEKKYDGARKLSKVQALLAQRQEKKPVVKPQNPLSQMPKTLNNNLSATPAQPRKSFRTDDDRVRDAIAFYHSQRKP